MRSSRSDGSSRLPWRKNKSSRPKKRRFGLRRRRRDAEPHDSERRHDRVEDSERYDDGGHYQDSRYAEESRGGYADEVDESRGHEDSRYYEDRRIDDRHDDEYEGSRRDEYEYDDQHADDRYDDDRYEEDPKPKRRKRRFSLPKRKKTRSKKRSKTSSRRSFASRLNKRNKYILIGVAALGLLILFLPTLVGMLMGGSFLESALSDVNGTVHVGSASMGWFSSTSFYDVEIRDQDGQTVFKSPELSSSKTAMSLYFDSSDLGKIQLAKPQAFVTFDKDGSNLEDVLAPWLEGPSTLNAPRMELKSEGGFVEIQDRRQGSKWQFQDVKVAVDLDRNWSEPMTLRAVAKMPQPDGATDVDVQLTMDRRGAAGGGVLQHGEADITTANFPLAALQSLLRRHSPDATLQGTGAMHAKLTWGNIDSPGWNMSIDGLADARNLRVRAPELGEDEIVLRTAKIGGNMAYLDDQLTIERLAMDCDFGGIDLLGEVGINTREGLTAGVTNALTNQPYEFTGDIDLAKLAAIMPRTLHLREGLQVTKGDIRWNLAHSGRAGAGQWKAHVETSQLQGRHGDEVVSWDKPIELELDATETATGLEIKEFRCYCADFIGLDAEATPAANGKPEMAAVSLDFNLDKLSAELSRFVDLGQTNFSGNGYGYLTWRRAADGTFETTWLIDVPQFELAIDGRAPWREDRLHIEANVHGAIAQGELTSISLGQVKVESGVDTLQAQLMNEVRRPGERSQWPLRVSLTGGTTSWLDRAQIWSNAPSRWTGRADGVLDVESLVVFSPKRIVVDHGSKVRVKDFVLETRNWKIVEPQVEMSLAGDWDLETDLLNLAKLQLKSPTGEIIANQARLEWHPGGPPTITGTANVNADLAKVQAWRRVAAKHGAAGRLVGEVRLANSGQTVVAQWTGRIDDFQLQTSENSTWKERFVNTSATARFDRGNDRLVIEQAQWVSDALTATATGRIDRVKTVREMTLQGELTYDPEKLVGLLKPYFGDSVQVAAARVPHPFRLHGELSPVSAAGTPVTGTFLMRADGEAQMSWTGANVYGFRLGAGELRFDMANGLLKMRPLDIAVSGNGGGSQGRLSLRAELDMREEQPKLRIPEPDRVLTNVTITPEIARQGSLRYLIPWINGVTAAQGTFSLYVDGAHVPLYEPTDAEAAGKLVVHDVSFAPGPLLRQVGFWGDLVRQLAGKPTQTSQLQSVRLMNESTVFYRVVDQRVYHKGLAVVFNDDVRITTQGWVGFDQTQAILAKIEAPELFARIPGASYLAENGLEIPIGGTVNEPQLDVAHIQQQLGGNVQTLLQRAAAAGNRMLAEELEKQLRKFLFPIR